LLSATFSGEQITSIQQRQEILHAPLDHAQPMFVQLQITNDLGLQ
jgi:hypothetical protein